MKELMRKNYIYLILGVIILFLIGIILVQASDSDTDNSGSSNQSSNDSNNSNSNNDEGLNKLVNYELPSGWGEVACSESGNEYLIVPEDNNNKDCANTNAPQIRISVDPNSYRDCNEIVNTEPVTKHTCISLFINGKKTLQTLTSYGKDSSFKEDTTFKRFYFDSGPEVIEFEYKYNGTDNQLESEFDELAKSAKTKN